GQSAKSVLELLYTAKLVVGGDVRSCFVVAWTRSRPPTRYLEDLADRDFAMESGRGPGAAFRRPPDRFRSRRKESEAGHASGRDKDRSGWIAGDDVAPWRRNYKRGRNVKPALNQLTSILGQAKLGVTFRGPCKR